MITAKRYRYQSSTKTLDANKTQEVVCSYDQYRNQCWQIATHDQEDGEKYQIAFSSSNPASKILMRIEAPILSENDEQTDRLEAETLQNGTVVWRQAYTPDYVTCSGVFRIIEQSIETGEIIDRTPWIYCLPQSISVVDYQIMLYDLFKMHDGLVQKNNSSVSIGSNNLCQWADQLVTAVHRIQRADTCVTILKKRYVKTRIERIKRFDSRVIQSYIQNGSSGIADGIVYDESNDVYENRIIKKAISVIANQLKTMSQSSVNKGGTIDFQFSPNAPSNQERKILEFQRKKHLEALKKKQEDLMNQQQQYDQAAKDAADKLDRLLSEKWFSSISNIEGNVFPLICTPVFSRNESYSVVYQLLSNFSKGHAALDCNFNLNGFGVKKTCDIYELWVLYKLLYKFDALDFKLDDSLASILEDFREHISGKEMPKQYKVLANKSLGDGIFMQIEFGYNCFLPNKDAPEYYTPDYYIKVKRDNQDHWYFLDAKYKSYHSSPYFPGVFDLSREIEKVAYQKYTVRLGELLPGKICGSYLIVSSINEQKPNLDEISKLDLLYGGDHSFSETDDYPDHQYGAIQLTPTIPFELDTLLKLIFEYKESEDRLPDNTPFLDYCWSCGQKMEIIPPDDPKMGHLNKCVIYRRCRNCEEFRVESYCLNCKSLLIKHAVGNYHKVFNDDKWNIVCPHCGIHL